MRSPRPPRLHLWLVVGLLAALLLPAWADDAPVPPAGGGAAAPEPDPAYLDAAGVAARLTQLEARGREAGIPALVTEYGTSSAGTPLLALWVGAPDARPLVLVHGGLGARDAAGSVACLDLAARLLGSDGAAALQRLSFVLVPAPNPDGLDAFLRGAPRAGGTQVDRDRDGLRGEDGPDDLDGDGEVRQMRRLSPRGTWASGAEAGREATPERDPRLLLERGLDPARQASYEVFDEGHDDDGDGRLNEDPPGMDLTRQMAGFWDHQGPWGGDGDFAGQAPEARALMELSYGLPNLVAWYGFRSEGPFLLRASEHGSLADADNALYDKIGVALRERTGVELRRAAEFAGGRNPGSDLDWAAMHLGALAFALPVWRIPKQEGHKVERPCADELDWLLWNDAVLAGEGFQPWRSFQHPTLGALEIGGWKRFTRHAPPASLLGAAARAVSGAPLAHAAFLPSLTLEVEVEDRGAGLFVVTARVRNAGSVPTETALAVARRRAHPVRLTLALEDGVERLAGAPQREAGVLASGASSEIQRWLLRRTAPRVNRDAERLLGTLSAAQRLCTPVRAEVLAP